ncbi:LLM class flavin-dependent oxidoreductase [Georgenia sp. 311]|nr:MULTISPECIES: LLM class flavin-dependent oxidoreductase [Georgenia]TNC18234.1 LLM class flavin-dependent oxidoreductase [Georgenia sp. 311]
MDYGHPLQLGVFLTPTAEAPHAAVDLAVRAEELGLDLVTIQDHPYQPRFHETWTLLSWIAGRTERIGLAPSVLNVPMRPPAVVARAAASLDLLSGGRLTLGLGAGVFWDAMEAMGVPRLTPGQSVAALEEAIEVVRGTWDAATPTPLSYRGEHHRLTGAQRGPAPAHTVPVWVGAARRRMLDLVGRLADGWVVPGGNAGVPGLRDGNAMIDVAAASAGRDPREVRRVLNVTGRFAPDAAGFLDGPPERWVADLLPLVLDDGVGTVVLASDDPATLERFARDVAPALREAVADARARRGTPPAPTRGAAALAARRPRIAYDDLPAALADTAVEPGDAQYAAVRSTYLRGGSPGLVLRPGTPEEVAEALAFARAQDVPLSLRSAGHGISGRSTNDGGIVLDVSRLNTIEVLDDATRLVRVGPGARWGEVAAALAPRGWAISSGDYGGVGVGGLATTGGIGFLGRAHGLTIDHVRAVELVLADGTHVRTSAEEHPDLFWAVRGAGFNFGVATAFEMQAAEVGDVGVAQLVYDASDTADLLTRWGAAVEAAPRELTSFLMMGAPRGGQLLAQTTTVVDSADPATIIAMLQPFAQVGPLVSQSVQVVPYSALVATPDTHPTSEGEPVSRTGLAEHLTPQLAADAERLVRSGSTFFFQIRSMGGAGSDVPPEATAFAHRSANFSLTAFGGGRQRLDGAWDAMAHHFSGSYPSFSSDPRPERLTEAYPPATLARLRELKRRYDPANVFRDNTNIAP